LEAVFAKKRLGARPIETVKNSPISFFILCFISRAISLVDRAAKKNLIHANKASRKKSALMKLTAAVTKAPVVKAKTKAVKKRTKK